MSQSRATKLDRHKDEDLVLGRYRLLHNGLLGEGGWCMVRRAVDLTGCAVAVKAFKPQAEKEVGREALQKRFQREVKAFHDIGIGPGSKEGAQEIDPRGYFVNLLDFSGFDSSPPPSVNCRCYTVLEIGDQSLDDWLQRGAVSLSGFCELAKALFKALKWLHGLGFIHMDVKPENIMRFGTRWKLIDLDCCMSCNDEMVTPENFTPLYASPELAREVLDTLEMDNPATRKLRPCPAMDIWAAGVVLLDVLAEGCCFAETKASFDAAALFEEEGIPFEGWYRWLASCDPLDVDDLLSGTPGAVHLQDARLRSLLHGALAKEPKSRLSAERLYDKLLEISTSPGRPAVERVFRAVGEAEPEQYSTDALLEVMILVGVAPREANRILEALDRQLGRRTLSYTAFLDFLYQ
ncbi:unnamed protein product [Effrenium voratum]|uniref:Protein kinase domain-containing protein n=1 Tax=Effrenium voratum TaxID=2562239 RepID=A0AA36JJJ9_9DINO|nr:unnamed protein product [Effrenium voratum]CAJ1438163.1 unnamed protein product [Effrenium voratum]